MKKGCLTFKKKMVLLPNPALVQHNPVSMGTRSLRSENVKQLVGLDECVCLLAKARYARCICQLECRISTLIYSCITDCFNVYQFNTRVKKTACFDHLVQANVRNKKLLKDAVQNITAKGITNYTKGFEFAFEQLSVVKYQVPLSLSSPK